MNDFVSKIMMRKSEPILENEIPNDILQNVFKCALTAPVHKNLRNWHFYYFSEKKRDELGQLISPKKEFYSDNLQFESDLKKFNSKFYNSPAYLICVLKVDNNHAVPVTEQYVTIGAVIQQIIISTELLGYACYWRTGKWCVNNDLREFLNLSPHDSIVGFISLGSKLNRTPRKTVVDQKDFFSIV